MGEWWNGIHATLKMLCPKDMRVRVPPRPQKTGFHAGFLFAFFNFLYHLWNLFEIFYKGLTHTAVIKGSGWMVQRKEYLLTDMSNVLRKV